MKMKMKKKITLEVEFTNFQYAEYMALKKIYDLGNLNSLSNGWSSLYNGLYDEDYDNDPETIEERKIYEKEYNRVLKSLNK